MALSLLALAAGCQREEIVSVEQDNDVMEVYATIEDVDDVQTRTYLSGTDVYWSSGDKIAVFNGNLQRKLFTVDPESAASKDATFKEDKSYSPEGSDTPVAHNVAYYPFCDVTCAPDGSSYTLDNLTLPETQAYVSGSVGLGSFPMVAVTQNTDDVNFRFQNICGVMQFQLTGYGYVKSVSVKGNNEEVLSGPAVVTAGYGKEPSIAMSAEGGKVVTLDCGEGGVELNGTTPVSFFIVLPPVQFEGGFTITVTDTWGGRKEYSTTKKNPVGRSKGLRMPAKEYIGVRPPQEGDYVDEYGINHGQGIEIDGVVWAPVNCGYHKDDFKYGKLYQWGRKYGQGYGGKFYQSNTESGEYADNQVAVISEGPVELSVGQDLQNEKYFYTSEITTIWSPQINDLWNKGTYDSVIKSEYDPCPDGWRVPTSAELDVLALNRSSWTTNGDGQEGYFFSGSMVYSNAVTRIFLPAAGSINFETGIADGRGLRGEYWSVDYEYSKYGGAYGLGFSNKQAGYTPYNRAEGNSVRCIREETASSEPSTINLSENGTANSYIVSASGAYKFTPTKGNSSTSVGSIESVEVLWETFGTDVTPNVGDLVKAVSYKDGEIIFQTADTFKEGNAVVAAKDASGNILWSWHIWLTDEPEEQVYYNNAGTMMDRNLGATSATPGDVGALGLLYQWGRKDPFLGSSNINSNSVVKTTITWPTIVSSDSSYGTLEYAITHPTTFITYNRNNYDWYYTGDSSTDNTRWTTSETPKSIYDPCPTGWRVPDGGSSGVWSKAIGISSSYTGIYDNSNEGMNFSCKFGADATVWYPAAGFRWGGAGNLSNVSGIGGYWSASPVSSDSYSAHLLYYETNGKVSLSDDYTRAFAYSVRCVREGTTSPTPSVPEYVDLSEDSSANSYIVSQKGNYKFKAVKGNSSESVGTVASVEVLWETFGTDVTPNVGDLVKNVRYADGAISFDTPSTFNEGNAVIAAKDESGTILWSWHIWLTDEPEEQVYYNNAGTMMDRNLGATSATPGDVGALGLLYQWGRKDPFLGSSSISSDIEAESTITWPSAVSTSSSTGTVDYVASHPTTFVYGVSSSDHDWCYPSRDNSLWTTSDKAKSIYDPCPSGWRVPPDGGNNGIWSKALGSLSDFEYDSTNEGMNFSGKFGSASTIWYPASGFRFHNDGSLDFVGDYGYYWSASPSSNYAYCLYFSDYGSVYSSGSHYRARGQAVRCVKE